jgi:hypothetical protein
MQRVWNEEEYLRIEDYIAKREGVVPFSFLFAFICFTLGSGTYNLSCFS